MSIEALGKILAAKLYTHFSLKGSKNVKKKCKHYEIVEAKLFKVIQSQEIYSNL